MRRCFSIGDRRDKDSINYIHYMSMIEEKKKIGNKIRKRKPITGFEIFLSNPHDAGRFGDALKRLGYVFYKEKDLAIVCNR